jgi:uncharacterized protein YndB with AHSA1/START domain
MRLVPSLIFGLLCVAGTRGADGLKPIELEVTVRAPLAAAWEAWATNDGAQKWFAPRTNIELKPGGAYEILFAPDKPAGERGAEDLHVLCYLPREMLAFEWNAPPQFAKARPQRTWVVLRFSDLGDGTVRMRLSHAGFAERAAAHADERAEWEQVHAYFTKAWPTVLGNLRKHLEKDAAPDESRQVCEAVIEAPIADVWHALTTKEGTEKWEFAHAEFDLRVGGTMRTHYSKNGKIGDPGTIENTFLALEPNRMFAIRVGKAPERFPFKEAIKSVWHVCYLEEAGPGRTRVRIVGLGYGADEESKKMRAFFEKGNNYTLKKLQEHFAAKATDKP